MAMGGGGVMDDGMGGMTKPTMPGHHDMGGDMAMRMTFFWGKRVEVLFSGWPGDRGLGMYLLALLCVVATAFLAECLCLVSVRLEAPTAANGSGRRSSTAVLLTFLYAVRVGLFYLVMLAVMSFNVGVLIAAIAGHALGFLLSASGLYKRPRPGDGEAPGHHAIPSAPNVKF